MVQRRGGYKRKSRDKSTKKASQRGKISLRRYFQSFKVGDRVYVIPEPAVQKGSVHLRFQGKSGIVTGSQGRCYYVTIKDGDKTKRLIMHPVHMKRA
ncbi:MAG: 50S ribosomal protein L21e [Nanoarchaeota archaeon]